MFVPALNGMPKILLFSWWPFLAMGYKLKGEKSPKKSRKV
jgi:hypothetical protein